MNKLAIAVASFVIGTSSAMAADLPVKTPPPAPLPIYSWTGFYGGVNAGYDWGKADWAYWNLPGQTLVRNPSGPSFGFHGGVQYQWNQFVIGVEASWSGSFKDIADTGPDAPIFAPAFDAKVKLTDMWTIGPRVGWVFSPQWMLFATGGYAEGRVWSGYFVRGFPQTPAAVQERQGGWFAGGGVEYLLTNWAYVGAEYRHVELDSELHQNTVVPATGNARYVTPSFDLVQFRLGFKITPGQTAVVAKY